MTGRLATLGSLLALLAAGAICICASPAWAGEAFGVESFASSIAGDATGAPAIQAGSHPYALTTAITFNHVVTGEEEGHLRVRTYGDPKDIELNLPPGVIVDPRATEMRCTEAELERPAGPAGCPNGAAVGVFSIYFDGIEILDEPVYNMAPPSGVPAELGFNAGGLGLTMHIAGKLRTGSDYGLSADISGIPEEHPIYSLKLTLWGDPSAASHDEERGLCADDEAKQIFKETGIRGSCPVEGGARPLLTLPTSCSGEPLATSISVDSWQEPDTPDEPPQAQSPAVAGCEKLDFSPKLTVALDQSEPQGAESASGLSVDLKLPGEESLNGLAEADLKDTVLTLPTGMAISPSAVSGRAGCTPEQIGLSNANVPSCPDASKVGEAKLVTPLLEDPLEGSIYLAQQGNAGPSQGSNPFESLLALYLVVENDGMLIKLAGKVEADPRTGQLTVTFDTSPQLPFSELKLQFFDGPRAVLVTPVACGVYATSSALTPWSGTHPVTGSSNLEISSGPGGGACPSGQFNPSFTAGTADSQAGQFSSFSLMFSRQDGQQRFGAVAVRMPPGLLGILKNVSPCPEPQASLGTCLQASQIGTTTVGAGPGPEPLYLPEPGGPANEVYLTGPYQGAPFGLSIVVPAIAGPFDLGNIVIRARIDIDPRTAQLTVSSDQGVGGIPTIKEGIPLDIRTISVNIDRADFMFNPTNCASLKVLGTIYSAGGASTALSSPFGVADCANLPFKPKLSALTQAQTSRADGAYLHVKVISGPGQANIGKVKVDLPKRLPARLTTLRRACVAGVFDADPASCPAAAVVGSATVSTPILAHPLTGPTYLVSHGGEAFPSLVMVLQGEGITLDLEGQLGIRRGVISTTFRSLPDAPISVLDLVFPTGSHSVLTANLPGRSLCSQMLNMSTVITGQDGAQVRQVIKIGVFGCPQHKQAKRKRVRG